MTPRKSTSSSSPAEESTRNALEWVKARLAQVRAWRTQRSLAPPTRKALHATRRSWWSSYWAARAAVRSGVPLEAYLQHRLSQDLGRLPVAPERLPVSFAVDSGSVVSTPRDSAGRPAWLESFLRAHGSPAVNPEILLGQADAARLAVRIEGQRTRVDELVHDVEAATRGVAIADPGDEVQAQQMGRPVIPQPIGLALQIFAVLLLLAESWPLAIPCMEVAGIHSTHLVAEVQQNPVGVILGSLFALGAAATLFLFAHLTVRRVFRVLGDRPSAHEGLWTALGAAFAVLLTVAMAWSIAGVRPGPDLPIEGGYTRATVFLAVLAIPFTSAWLFTVGARLEQARATAVALARAWDQEHYRVLADINRRATALAEEERRLSSLEAERARVIERMRSLQARAATAERLAADAAAEEQQELGALAQAISAALELDRYEYLRQSASRGIPVVLPEIAAAPTPAPVRGPREVPERNLGLAG